MKKRVFIYHVHKSWHKKQEIDFISFWKTPVKYYDGSKSKIVEITIKEKTK